MPINEINHTGKIIEAEGSIAVLKVVAKLDGTGIYVMENYIKGFPDLPSGRYFVTEAQLEATIIGYETGLWLSNEIDE